MELSRERKVFVGLFGVAVLVLGADRVLLGPSSASAAVPLGATTPGPALPASAQGSTAPVDGVARTLSVVAERLRDLDQTAAESFDSDDAFALPGAWLAADAPVAPAPLGAPGPRAPSVEVTSVMPTSQGGIAIIDGKAYRQGEQVGAFLLEAVEPRSVILRAGDELHRVPLVGRH